MFDLVKIVVILMLVWLELEAHKIQERISLENSTQTFDKNEEAELIFAHVVSIAASYLSFSQNNYFLFSVEN